MITLLSGGTGTPKMIRGLRKLMADGEITVVVNTAEDMWISGNHLSPDIDTVMYLFAEFLNTETWWGIRDDTFVTHEYLRGLGEEEYIAIGDRDRAVHIVRSALLNRGMTLTDATKAICRAMRIDAEILPMTDSVVTTYVATEQGLMHFQEYWVKHRGSVSINDVIWRYDLPPLATPEVKEALRKSDAVIIGPSNPITSITPILNCAGVRDILGNQPVIAISPFIGDAPVSGPAKALMEAFGYEPTSRGTYELYREFVNVFVQDIRDPDVLPGAVRLDTLMINEEKSISLAEEVINLIR